MMLARRRGGRLGPGLLVGPILRGINGLARKARSGSGLGGIGGVGAHIRRSCPRRRNGVCRHISVPLHVCVCVCMCVYGVLCGCVTGVL